MAALTALTAQNTQGVSAVHVPPASFVAAQIRDVFADVRVDAVKIGMLADAEIASAVADALDAERAAARLKNLVLDPVMIATSGDRLLADDAVAVLRDRLIPMADVITPNLPEGAALLNRQEPATRDEMAALASDLLALGAGGVLLKGGHLPGPMSPDALATAGGVDWFEAERLEGRPIHGGGCTLSSAVATFLGRGDAMPVAVDRARRYVWSAIAAADGLSVGGGARPLHHFHPRVEAGEG